MTYKPRSERKRASGGKATDTEPLPKEHWNQYNAKGSPEEKEEDAKPDGFKRGGAKKRKEGGHVEGEKAKHHLGRRARGGSADAEPRHGEEIKSREDTTNDERKRGGHVEERARGGHVKAMMSGGSPFSTANKTKPPSEDKETGPGEQAPMIP